MPPNHSVYVVELDPKVLDRKKIQRANPDRREDKPPVYVGMTGLSVEERFKKHKAGLKANQFVKTHGLRLLHEHTIRNLSFNEAEAQEELIAKKMRASGHPVIGGNPQMRKFADWSDFDRKRKLQTPAKQAVMPPQQQRVVDKIKAKDQPGLVLFHGMGSGKTKSSIEAYKALKMPTDVIVPAALRENYRKELRKWTGGVPDDINIISQQRFSNPALDTKLYNSGLQIVDEAQKAKNIHGELYQRLKQTNPRKRLLLSGTPMLNDPTELSALVNLAAGKDLLPTNPSDFRKQYVKTEEVSPGLLGRFSGIKPGQKYVLQNREELGKILSKYVDYYKPSLEGYPTVKEEEIRVPMGPNQQNLYNSILGKASWWTRYKVKHNIPPARGEMEGMKAFLSGPRQVSNTTNGFTVDPKQFESPKIQKAFDYFKEQLAKDPSYKGLVYSNYLQSGIKPYEELLRKNKIPYGEFSGDMPARAREQAVRDYNEGKLKALMISGAGAEGLDLKKTRLEQLLDPHWNLAKERQVIGRGARYKSHEGLPPEKQNVLVQRYFAQPAPSLLDRITFNSSPTGTDEYIHNLAKQKDQLNQEVTNLIARGRPTPGWFYWDR